LADEPRYKREAVDIPDVPALVKQLLSNPLLDHMLYLVVPDEKIVFNYEGTWQEYPGIYITDISMVPDLVEENIPGGIGSTWAATVQIHLITSKNSYINYPPGAAVAGETDDESTRENGAENVLKVLKWLVYRTIAENRRGYQSDVLPTFQWDNAIYDVGELIDGGYEGVDDIWAYIMTYTFECQVVSRT
jgi:hypothetical protein